MESSETSTLSDVKFLKLVVVRRTRHHRRVDERANAALFADPLLFQTEAEKIVDFLLVEDAVGAAGGTFQFRLAVVDHGGPGGRHVVIAAGALFLERGAPGGG